MKNLYYVSILFLIVIFGCKSEDDNILEKQKGNLEITVKFDVNTVLRGAKVITEPFTKEIITDDSGIAFFENIEEGDYKVYVETIGDSENYETDARVLADQTTFLEVILDNPPGIEPDPLNIDLVLKLAYDNLKNRFLFDASGYPLYGGDIGVDISYTNRNQNSIYNDLDRYLIFATTPLVNEVWTDHYEIIHQVNQGLEYLENETADINSNVNINEVTGELKFIRALLYFNLIKLYGNPILVTKANTIVDVSDPSSTIQDPEKVYELIIDDLKYAESNLEQSTLSIKASVYAAQALLGKVYMQMAGFPLLQTDKYQKALEQFNKIDGVFTLETNYKDIFSLSNESGNTEVIFSIAYEEEDMFKGNYGALWGPLGVTENDVLLATPEFIRTYTKNTNDFNAPVNFPLEIEDTRFYQNVATFALEGNTTVNKNDIKYWRPYKFKKDEIVASVMDNEVFDFPYLRYADILLCIAEVENEINGPTSKAYEAINKVRRRAFGNIDNDLMPGLTKQQFFDAVLKERALELCFEGHRKNDLVRTQKLESVILEFNNNASVENRKDFQLHEFIWPIPQREISVNPNVIQNPGY